MIDDIIKSSLSIALVFTIIYFLWYILWKFVFEPNPLVRDFFDLENDKKSKVMNSATLSVEPACHSYLGNDQQDVFTHLSWTDSPDSDVFSKEWKILLIALPDVVIFPGETLPLRLSNNEMARQIQASILKNRYHLEQGSTLESPLIGIVNDFSQAMDRVGTALEVRSLALTALTARSRLRFRVTRLLRQSDLTYGLVRFLPDSSFGPRYRAVGRQRRAGLPFPLAVYVGQSPESLARRAFALFAQIVFDEDGRTQSPAFLDSLRQKAESDPVGFSFRLCANLPLTVAQLQALLDAQDVLDRLRMLLAHLRKEGQRLLGCAGCGAALARQTDLFSLEGADGMAGAYVNPHGVVHPTLTVRCLLDEGSVIVRDRPTLRDSWFPGFAWSIVHCERCFGHLGWRFTAASPAPAGPSHHHNPNLAVLSVRDSESDSQWAGSEDDEYEYGNEGEDESFGSSRESERGPQEGSSLSPNIFWGLRRSALKLLHS